MSLSQVAFIDSFKEIQMEKQMLGKQNQVVVDEHHKLKFQVVIGNLMWLACVTRPDIAAAVSLLSRASVAPTVDSILQANKLVRYAKQTKHCYLVFKKFDEKTNLLAYGDAAFQNVDDGDTQGGSLVMMATENLKKNKDNTRFRNVGVIAWKSCKIKRRVTSTESRRVPECSFV